MFRSDCYYQANSLEKEVDRVPNHQPHFHLGQTGTGVSDNRSRLTSAGSSFCRHSSGATGLELVPRTRVQIRRDRSDSGSVPRTMALGCGWNIPLDVSDLQGGKAEVWGHC